MSLTNWRTKISYYIKFYNNFYLKSQQRLVDNTLYTTFNVYICLHHERQMYINVTKLLELYVLCN